MVSLGQNVKVARWAVSPRNGIGIQESMALGASLKRVGQTFWAQSNWLTAGPRERGCGEASPSLLGGVDQAGKGLRAPWVMCQKGNFSPSLQIVSLRKSLGTPPFPL